MNKQLYCFWNAPLIVCETVMTSEAGNEYMLVLDEWFVYYLDWIELKWSELKWIELEAAKTDEKGEKRRGETEWNEMKWDLIKFLFPSGIICNCNHSLNSSSLVFFHVSFPWQIVYITWHHVTRTDYSDNTRTHAHAHTHTHTIIYYTHCHARMREILRYLHILKTTSTF